MWRVRGLPLAARSPCVRRGQCRGFAESDPCCRYILDEVVQEVQEAMDSGDDALEAVLKPRSEAKGAGA